MKTYKILTLGASGSGKTVFLASMFKALGIQADHGFCLNVNDSRQQKLLNAIYTEIIAGEIWPKGTREISEWSYICRVKNPDDLEYYDACKFVYFDYAGGRLTDMDEEDTDFQDIIKQSDAMLGLLDGKKIYALMSSSNQSDIDLFLNKDLPSVIKGMLYSQAPIHFVISKWDIIEKEFSLKQVRDRLLEIDKFKTLVDKRHQVDSPVRLIPISSVGSNFAVLTPDGSMKKIPGAIPKPFQVEVPISCVFSDTMLRRINELNQQKKQLEKKKLDGQNIFLQYVQKSIDSIFEELLNQYFPSDLGVTKRIINQLDDFFFSQVRRKNEERLQELRAEREISLKNVHDEKTALEHAVNSFLYIQENLNSNFPESKLTLP